MSDFDTVLERLMVDPAFRAALGADPAAVLRGYRLTPDEIELLHSQIDSGTGGVEHRVEQRTSKAGLFGLLSPLMDGAGTGAADATGLGERGPAGWYERDGMAGTGAPGGFGDAPGIGDPLSRHGGPGGLVGHNVDDIQQRAGARFGTPPPPPPPPGYHPHIDVDGDGHWDTYTVQGRTDGGVDLVADVNRDGRADFVGHDLDQDGLVDSADYDEDRDGTFETHMRDVDGDGWLDTRRIDR